MTTSASRHRSVASAAAIVAMLGLVPVALRQLRAVQHLPDPPSLFFDSDEITGSPSAYPLGVPDSLLGLASYGVSLTLLQLVPSSSLPSPHVQRRVLKAKLSLDAGLAIFNAVRQPVVFGKLCSWCMIPVLATAVMIPNGLASLRDGG